MKRYLAFLKTHMLKIVGMIRGLNVNFGSYVKEIQVEIKNGVSYTETCIVVWLGKDVNTFR